jgi:hypothetical protein
MLDGDGLAAELGDEGARRLADDHAARAHDALGELDADTSVLADIVDSLTSRTT